MEGEGRKYIKNTTTTGKHPQLCSIKILKFHKGSGLFQIPLEIVLSDQFHDPIGFEKDFDDALVVDEVGIGELTTFTVFEPFLCRLVTAYVEVPGEFGHVAAVLGFVDPDLAVGVSDLFDQAISRQWESGLVIINDRRLHEVEFAQFTPKGNKAVKLSLGGDGNAGKVDF